MWNFLLGKIPGVNLSRSSSRTYKTYIFKRLNTGSMLFFLFFFLKAGHLKHLIQRGEADEVAM